MMMMYKNNNEEDRQEEEDKEAEEIFGAINWIDKILKHLDFERSFCERYSIEVFHTIDFLWQANSCLSSDDCAQGGNGSVKTNKSFDRVFYQQKLIFHKLCRWLGRQIWPSVVSKNENKIETILTKILREIEKCNGEVTRPIKMEELMKGFGNHCILFLYFTCKSKFEIDAPEISEEVVIRAKNSFSKINTRDLQQFKLMEILSDEKLLITMLDSINEKLQLLNNLNDKIDEYDQQNLEPETETFGDQENCKEFGNSIQIKVFHQDKYKFCKLKGKICKQIDEKLEELVRINEKYKARIAYYEE
ncbi:MAG: hypothetical protein MHMPM18_003315 [Marteilia pararefringens]